MLAIPSSNIITRTFKIRYKTGTGTVFEVDHGDSTFLVTAYHVVEGIQPIDQIEIATKRGGVELPVTLVGTDGDVCVLRTDRRLSPEAMPLVLTSNGLQLGQAVSF